MSEKTDNEAELSANSGQNAQDEQIHEPDDKPLLDSLSKHPFKTRLLDYLMGTFFITPVTVFFWSSTWLLEDLFIFPRWPKLSLLVCIWSSLIFILIMMLLQNIVFEYFEGKNKYLRLVLWSLFLYLLGVAVVTSWRGWWMLMDEYTTHSVLSAFVSHALGFIILSLTNSACNIASPPGFILKDDFGITVDIKLPVKEINHWIPTKDISQRTYLFINSFFTVVVIGTFVVSYWRGTWNLMEFFNIEMEFPSRRDQRIFSYCLGTTICTLCFWLSEPLGSRIAKGSLPDGVKVFTELVFAYVLGFGIVNIWMGWWYVDDQFMRKAFHRPALMAVITHVVSVVLLFSGRCAMNLLGPPAGCRMHTRHTLEGFNMGSYFGLPVAPQIVKDDAG